MTQDAAHFRLAKSRKLRLRTAPRKSTGYVRQGDEVDCTGRSRAPPRECKDRTLESSSPPPRTTATSKYEVRSAGPAWLGGLALRKANTRRRGGDRGQRRPTRRRVFRPRSRRLHINLSGVVELNNFGTHVGVPQGSTTGNTVVRELGPART